MEISGIDKEFVSIISYLNSNGYKTFASCDGVLDSHENKESVTNAYIGFLESGKIFELMAAFLRDSNFLVTIYNGSNKPFDLYGNAIFGNQYAVYFNNKHGEFTKYFEKIIVGVTKGDIQITQDEIDRVIKLRDIVQAQKESDLGVNIGLNEDIDGCRGEGITIIIDNKADAEVSRDIEFLASKVYEQFNSTEFPMQYEEDTGIKYEWVNGELQRSPRINDRRIMNSSPRLKIHLLAEDEDMIPKILDYIREIEQEVPQRTYLYAEDFDNFEEEYEAYKKSLDEFYDDELNDDDFDDFDI